MDILENVNILLIMRTDNQNEEIFQLKYEIYHQKEDIHRLKNENRNRKEETQQIKSVLDRFILDWAIPYRTTNHQVESNQEFYEMSIDASKRPTTERQNGIGARMKRQTNANAMETFPMLRGRN